MSPGQFMMAIASHLVSDRVLQDWCLETLGKEATIQVGVDEENPPDVDIYPIIVLVNCVQDRGDRVRPSMRLAIGCGIYNKSVTEELRFKVYQGIVQGADFGNQVEASCFRSNLGSFEVVGEHIPISFHPIHVTNTSLQCELVKSSRRPMR